MTYDEVSAVEYRHCLRAAQRYRREDGQGREALCVADPGDDARMFLSADGMSGFALRGNYLTGVFSQGGGRLEGIIAAAERFAGGPLHLDCFEPLARVYARHGFEVTDRIAFDWQYAPTGWTQDMGTPDVVMMARAEPALMAA